MADNADLFVDLSSNNGAPNLPKHYRAGHRILALKATEGVGYVWDRHRALADEWHRLGGTVWHYHFARPGAAVKQADHFLTAVAICLAPGDRLVLDAEIAGVGAPFTRSFLHRCHTTRPNFALMVYGSAYFLRDNKIRPAHGAGLWLAGYPTYPFIPPGWKHVTAHQFSDHATVEGIPGTVDLSSLTAPPKPKHRPTTPGRYRAWRRWINFWRHW